MSQQIRLRTFVAQKFKPSRRWLQYNLHNPLCDATEFIAKCRDIIENAVGIEEEILEAETVERDSAIAAFQAASQRDTVLAAELLAVLDCLTIVTLSNPSKKSISARTVELWSRALSRDSLYCPPPGFLSWRSQSLCDDVIAQASRTLRREDRYLSDQEITDLRSRITLAKEHEQSQPSHSANLGLSRSASQVYELVADCLVPWLPCDHFYRGHSTSFLRLCTAHEKLLEDN